MRIQRGRKAAASFAIVPGAAAPWLRPDPPADLTEAEQEEWRLTVDRMPPGHFTRETFPLLADYCRFAANSKWIGEGIAALREGSIYDPRGRDNETMLREQRENSTHMAMLASKLRLTPQSRGPTRPGSDKFQKNANGGKRPWQ